MEENPKVPPERVLKTINAVMEYVGDLTNDYLTIRKEIIRLMAPVDRKWFTPRHHSTKRIQLGENDYQLIAYWESKTGVSLLIDATRLHNPNWKPQGKKGWNLTKDLRKANHEDPETKIFAISREDPERFHTLATSG